MLIEAFKIALEREQGLLRQLEHMLSDHLALVARCHALLCDPHLKFAPETARLKLQETARGAEELLSDHESKTAAVRGRIAHLEANLAFEERQRAVGDKGDYFTSQLEMWNESWKLYIGLMYEHSHRFAGADRSVFAHLSAAEYYERERELQQRLDISDAQPFRDWFLSFEGPPKPLDLDAWPQTSPWPPDEPPGMWDSLCSVLGDPDPFVSAYAQGALYCLGAARAMREYRTPCGTN